MTNLGLISIIIPTRNEERNLVRCLKSIQNNSYKNVEIIIVDQDSNDKTLEIAKNFNCKIIPTPATKEYLPPSNSRNIGFNNSQGEFIYHLDADMELESDLLEEINNIFKNPDIGAIVIPEKDVATNIWAKAKAFERSLYENTEMEAARVSRRKIFSQTGYDTEIHSGEDWNIHEEFKKNSLVSRTKSYVKHYLGNISLKKEFSKKYNYGLGSRKFVESKKTKIKNIYFFLLKRYIQEVFKNIFRNPKIILAFLIIRFVDSVALSMGLIASSFQKIKI